MGKQIAPDEPMFAGMTSGADSLDMELHGSATSLDMDLAGGTSVPDIDLGEEPSRADSSGIDFILDAPDADGLVPPTIETPRLKGDNAPTVESPRFTDAGSDTQEVTVNDLGLDLDSLRALEALDARAGEGGEGVDSDTVETAGVPSGGTSMLDDADLLSATSLMKMGDSTAVMPLDETEPGVVDLSEVTGELPLLDVDLGSTAKTDVRDYDLGGEAATMSEVGTKLDLARAYVDMGDPEGARSILDEVLQEGNAAQKQEAQRLVASLP
jgi:pilus assembly protein FimV